jgi:hypothetical protein
MLSHTNKILQLFLPLLTMDQSPYFKDPPWMAIQCLRSLPQGDGARTLSNR